MINLPTDFCDEIHLFLAVCGSTFGLNQVQFAPFSSSVIGLGTSPLVITIAQPACVAVRAAMSFVIIPPLEIPETPSPAISSISGVISLITSNLFASGFVEGLLEYKPSTSDNKIKLSALTVAAIWAASLSLSPKRISSVATVSFSLTIGTTPKVSSLSIVARVFKYLRRLALSSNVTNICAVLTENGASTSSYARANLI